MKNNIKKAICILTLSICMVNVNAQVGIGNATPHASSILDLTTTPVSNKGILLPKSSVPPSSLPSTPEGLAIYYSTGFYMKDATGFNNLNSWKYKYNGQTDESVSFNPTSLTGVGIGINHGGVLGYLHVSGTSKQVVATSNSAALFIGNTTATPHMIFDVDEIMVKATATTGGTLKLQEEDGSMQIGSNRVETVDKVDIHLNTNIGTTTNKKDLTVNGNINAAAGKVQEFGNSLLPPGSIIMFNGTTAPAGWALCDGRTATYATGTTFTTPDLRSRMIMAYGETTNAGALDAGLTAQTSLGPGGSDGVSLVASNLPQHTHTGDTKTDGNHYHSHTRYLADNDDNDDTHYSFGTGGGSDPQGASSAANISNSASNHKHALNTVGQVCNNCGGTGGVTQTKVDTRSAYYVVAFIIKL